MLLQWQVHIPYKGRRYGAGRLGSDDGEQEAQMLAEMQDSQVRRMQGSPITHASAGASRRLQRTQMLVKT